MQKKLQGRMGLLEALTIGIGTMIGAGIFVLSGTAAGIAGPAALFSFLIAGLAVLPTALSFAELATAFPEAGGPYTYVRQAFGPLVGFITGWSLWVGLSLTSAFYCIGFGLYLTYFLPIPWGVSAVLMGAVILLINSRGAEDSSRLQNGAVLSLLVLLSIYLIAGYGHLDRELHSPFFPWGWVPVLQASALVFVSFLGFELIATAAEEIVNPGRNLPLATVLSVVLVMALYAAIVYVATGLRSCVDLGQSPTPIADTAEMAMGSAGGLIIAASGLLATISSANGSVMAASRICYALGRNRELPGCLQYTHPVHKSPVNAVASTGALAVLAIIFGDAQQLAAAAGFLHLYPFILVNFSVLLLRHRPGYRPSFRAPGGLFTPLVGAFAAGLLMSQSGGAAVVTTALLLMPGLAYYWTSHTLVPFMNR